VTEHVRPKYACPHCQEGVVIAELPPRPIEKGRPGPGLLANVLVSKYADHLPLHRQKGIFARHGIELSRSTMCDWVRGGSSASSIAWTLGVTEGAVRSPCAVRRRGPGTGGRRQRKAHQDPH
jgi:hypothetical protein